MVRSGAHRTGIAGAAFNRLADSVATVDTRGHVYAFHIRKNRYQLLAREGDEGTAVAITDKEVFAGFINGVIKIYDQDKGAVVATLKGHRSRVTHVEVSPGGDYLLSSSNDSVFLWDLTSPSYAKRALSGGAYGAVQAKFAGPTGDKVVVAFHDESLWVWVTDSGELLFKLDPPDLGARSPIHGPTLCQSICISPDARHVITAGGSPCLFVWDLEARALSHAVELPQPTQHASDVQSLPGGNFVAVVCDDGAVRIVDPFKGAVTHTMVVGDEMHGGKEKMAEGLCVEPKGRYGAVIAAKGQMRLYDLHIARAQKQKEHPVHLKSIPISADVGERTIASGEVAGPGSAGVTLPEAIARKKNAPSKELLDAVFPPLIPRASTEGDIVEPKPEKGAKTAAWGPPPGQKHKLGEGRRGPMPGVAKAAPASSHAATNFPMPSSDFLDDPDADPTEADITKLRNLLHAHGEFPAKYRLLTWRKLLRLPNNEDAYEALSSKGIHPAMADLPERFPISDRTLLLRLQRVCSSLSHWSPIFAESPIVPGMVFPFVKAFGANEVHAFEAFATVVNNHARGWFDLFPDPPHGALAEVEGIVRHHDQALADHMQNLPGGLQGGAWQLLSTLFTDVTTADEWLKLFDHIVAVGREMLPHLAAAFLVIWRDTILAAPEGSTAIKQLFARDAGTSLPRLLKTAYELRHKTPTGVVALNPTKIVDANPGVRPEASTLPAGGVLSMPKGGSYPVFEGFPKRAVDWAAQERERLRAEEDALLARQKVVKNLAKKTEELQRMEMAWESEAQRMAEVEEARRSELDQIENSMKTEMARWEERERLERIRQVEVIESAYQASLHRKKSEWNAELDKLRAEVDEKRAAQVKEMKRQQEEEQLRSLEFQAQQRLWAMEEEQAHKSSLARVRQEMTAAEAVRKTEEMRRSLEWQTQDDEAEVRRTHEAARRVRLVAQQQEADAKVNAQELLLRESWEAEAQTAMVEKERRLRVAAETEAALSNEMVDAARIRDQTIAAAEMAELERAATLEKEQFAEASRARRETIHSEWTAAARDAEARVSRMREAERAGRRAALESAAAERRRVLLATAAEEEAAVQRAGQLVAAQRRRDQELEAEMQARAAELAQRIAHAEKLAEAEKISVAEEREKFHALQEQLAHRAADQEGEARRRHDETMAKLVLEREKQLVEMDTAWRKKVARSEMTHLQDEAAAYRAAMREREAAYAAREKEYLTKIEELRAEAAAVGVPGDASFPLMPPGTVGPGTMATADASAAAARLLGESSAGAAGVLERQPETPKTKYEASNVASAVAGRSSLAAAGDEKTPKGATTGAAEGNDDSPVSGASPETGSAGESASSEDGTPVRSTIDVTAGDVGRSAITESTPGDSTRGDISLGDIEASAGKKGRKGKGKGRK